MQALRILMAFPPVWRSAWQSPPLDCEDLDAEAGVLRCVGQGDGQGKGPGAHGQRLCEKDLREGFVGLRKLPNHLKRCKGRCAAKYLSWYGMVFSTFQNFSRAADS